MTDGPAADSQPQDADPPVVTVQPPSTDAPAASDPPSSTDVPTVTAAPAETEVPVIDGGGTGAEDTPAVTEAPKRRSGGAGTKKKTRDLVRYPVFSKLYPSRRLNLPTDPEAWAEIPGEKIWPEPETSSPLQQLLGN